MKQEKEIKIVTYMIELYCKKNHGGKRGELCGECAALLDYVKLRRSKCPWGDGKPFCSNCSIHCYKPDMRAKIAKVMRFSGPRIIFSHPVAATRHLIESKAQKRKLKKSAEKGKGTKACRAATEGARARADGSRNGTGGARTESPSVAEKGN